MVLRRGDTGDAVKTLQRDLNKLGSMLLVDGQFGRGTRDAVADARVALGQPGPPEADDELQAALAAVLDPFPPVTAAGVTFIARAEVSDATTYRRTFQVPIWPSRASGITVGIGYDCQFVSPDELHADWAGLLDQQAVDRLASVCQEVGSEELLDSVKDVVVPLPAAVSVFAKRSLPKYLQQTRDIYPEVVASNLTPAQRTALLSLVYNRGPRLFDKDPVVQERREMRAIQTLLATGLLDGIADQFEAMTRLWDPAELPGLITRRHNEATLWRSGFPALQLD